MTLDPVGVEEEDGITIGLPVVLPWALQDLRAEPRQHAADVVDDRARSGGERDVMQPWRPQVVLALACAGVRISHSDARPAPGRAVVVARLGLELREVIEQVADDFHEACHGAGVGGEYEEIDDRLSAFLARYPGY